MGKLLTREIAHELARMLSPREGASEQEEQRRYEALQAAGFQVIWDHDRVQSFQSLGAVTARVRADGARWPLSRAAKLGYAYMVHSSDFELFEELTKALNGGERARSGDELKAVVDALAKTLQGRKTFDAEKLAALETVVRLGDAAAPLLSGGDVTW